MRRSMPAMSPAGQQLHADGQYFNTFVLEQVQLFDAKSNPISAWTLQDTNSGENVFDRDRPPRGHHPGAGLPASSRSPRRWRCWAWARRVSASRDGAVGVRRPR